MKPLNSIVKEAKMYATADTERFVAKHAVKVAKLSKPAEDDKLFKATNIKTIGREDQHGYDSDGSDEQVYEDVQQVDEKHLTPAEKKKREQIAKAMERQNPGMDKSRKMAIATATAKRVAEEIEQLEEGADAEKRYQEYHDQAKGLLDSIGKHLETTSKSRGDNVHWGHVGDVRSVHDQLRDIHDRLAETGEYAKADAAMQKKHASIYSSMKEEVEMIEEVDIEVIIDSILEEMSEDEREEFISMMEDEEGCKEIVQMIDEAFAAEQSEE